MATNIEKRNVQDIFELNMVQKGILYHYLKEADENIYNAQLSFRITGDLDPDALEKAIHIVQSGNEALRSVFRWDEVNKPLQIVLEDCPAGFAYYDLSQKDTEESRGMADELSKKERDERFDLTQLPFRCSVIRTAVREFIFNITHHHILYDGWSTGILLKELFTCYDQLTNHITPALPAKRGYREVLAPKKNGNPEIEEAFWKSYLQGSAKTCFLSQTPNRGSGDEPVQKLYRTLSNARLEAFAREHKVTKAAVIYAAYGILLHKYAASADVVFGTTVSTRGSELAGDTGIMGNFINTVPLRVTNIEESSLLSVVMTVNKDLVAMNSFTNTSYSDIKQLAGVKAAEELFDSVIVVENYPLDVEAIQACDNLDITLRSVYENTNIPLVFCVFFRENLEIEIIYRTDTRFDFSLASAADSFTGIIDAICDRPEDEVRFLDLLPEDEKHQLLYTFNETEAAYPREETVLSLFEQQVEKDADRVALEYGDTTVSYRQLDDRAGRIGAFLRRVHGIKAGDLVGIAMERDVHLVPVILGILKAGAAYVPIDPHYPLQRKASIIEDSALKVLITRGGYEGGYSRNLKAVIDLDSELNNIYDYEPDGVGARPGRHDLAYVIYTSGSTGKPKGVMIKHGSLINYISWAASFYAGDVPAVFPLFTSISFDLTVTSLFTPLISAGRIIVYPEEAVDVTIGRIIGEGRANTIKLTPSHLKILRSLETGEAAVPGGKRKFIVGGEDLDTQLARDIYDQFSGEVDIYNEYGPTEATVGCMIYTFNPDDALLSVPIGVPIQNTQVYLLDNYLNPVPVGVSGELYIGGDGLAKGYLSQETLTRQKFVENPFLEGKRMYRTGDLAAMLPGGQILFRGRADDQVKIRGHRIEPGEIESRLSLHPLITGSVVVARTKGEDKYLVGYYVAAKELEAREIKSFLSDKLPEHMIPAYYVRLEQVPLTINGKLDKAGLPEPGIDWKDEYVLPKTEEEKLLAEVWAKVLRRENIGAMDNFFSAGGDSIKSIQIGSRMRALGYELSVKDIFNAPTIKELATKLRVIKTVSHQSKITGRVGLTPIQRWFFDGPVVAKQHYNQSVMLHLPEGLSVPEARALFGKLQEHHDALRMVFRQEGEEWSEINKGVELPVSVEEFDHREHADPNAATLADCNRIQSGINLRDGPLMKIGLFQSGEGSRVLIVIHHLVVDGVSWRILLEDVDTLYRQVRSGSTLSLPLKTDSYQYWSACLSEYVKGRRFQKACAYWDAMPETDAAPIAVDHPGGRPVVRNMKCETFYLDKETTARLLTQANSAFHTRVDHLLLAALLLAVERQFGLEKLRIDLEGHGREDLGRGENVSRTVGWFTSIYPVLLQSRAGGLAATVKNVKETLRRVPNNGLDYLLYRAGSAAASPIIFNYLGQFDDEDSGNVYVHTGGATGNEVSPDEIWNYAWGITGLIAAGELKIDLRYSLDQYKAETIRTLMDRYRAHLTELIDYCSNYGKQQLTPSDLSYKELPMEQLDALQEEYAVADIYPLSPMQEGMLFHSLLDPDGEHYFVQVVCRVEGHLDIPAVERSLQELVNRYDVLRTVFLPEGHGRPMQMVLQRRVADFTYEDMRLDCQDGSRDEVVRLRLKQNASRKFDLEKDMLTRLHVLRTGEEEYSFIWSHHHIVMDGWCMGTLINDFKAIYSHIRRWERPILAPVKPYSRYISWLQDSDRAEAAQYWRNYLQGYESPATLPKRELSSPGSSLFTPGSLELSVSKDRTRQLNKLSREHGVTLNTILQAAWGILLCRYNNTNDVVFGSVVSGRPAEMEGVETMMGLFINTVPVRVSHQEDGTIGQLLKDIQAAALQSEPYHYHPLPEILPLSKPGRDLLDHVLIVENYPLANEIMAGQWEMDGGDSWRITDVGILEQTNYDLTIVVIPGEDITIRFEYNSHTYDAEMMRRMTTHLDIVLGQLAADSKMKLSAIEIVTGDERQQLLHLLDNSRVAYPRDKTITQLFEAQAGRTPDSVAICCEGEQLTYAQLNTVSARLAAALQKKGVCANAIVGLLMDRSIDTVVGMLAILKAGGAYLPIDVDYPEERIEYLIKDSGVSLVLTSRKWPRDQAYGRELVLIEDLGKDAAGEYVPEKAASPADLCYVIYTSGTTGNPKGVMVEHRNVVRLLFNDAFQFDFGAADVWTMFHSHCFDFSVWEIYGALLFGGRLIVVPRMIARDTKAYLGLLKAEGVTVLNQTPGAFYNLIREELACPDAELRLRYAIFGGEALNPGKLKAWNRKYPGVRLINMFGITETTVHVTYKQIGEYEIQNNISNVGRPIPTLLVYILDQYRHLVPAGVIGELYVGGEGVARGYLGRAELTNTKFIPDPYHNGETLYRSGDLARMLDSGDIEYIGRMDNQVKIRGFRIELGEIESQLAGHSGIKENIVVARETGEDKRLACYYISEEEIPSTELRSFLSGKLPDYMIPAWFVRLEAMPLTANGKLDRKALPAPERWAAGNGYLAPRTREEQLLAEVWSSVLGADSIGITDDFFSVGGDSIKSIQISSRMRTAGYDLSVKDIFTSPTIRELGSRLKPITTVADQSPVTGAASLTPVQRWFLRGSLQDNHHYNQSVLLNFPQGVDEATLRTLFTKLQEHHDALRMVFRMEGEQLMQYNMGPDLPVSFVEFDYRGTAGAEAKALMLAACNHIQAGINLLTGPLMKLGLFHCPDGSRLLIVIHHLVVDGVSWRILFEDIETLYRQLQESSPLSLPLKTDPFLSWPARLQDYMGSKAYKQAVAWWQTALPAAVDPIPRDHPNGAARTGESRKLSFRLTADATSRLLTEAHSAFHTQINDLLLTALLLAIGSQYSRDTLMIDLEAHGREELGRKENMSRTVGWFTSIYPVVLEGKPDNLAAAIKSVKETLRRVPNNGIDYLLHRAGTGSAAPMIFNYLGQFDSDIAGRSFLLAAESPGQMTDPQRIRDYDWDISGAVTGGQLEMEWRYNPEQYNDETIRTLMHRYKDKLSEIIDYCCRYGKQELTPSDLCYKELSMLQLEALQGEYTIDDIYPLSPMQEGLLFHSLLDPNGVHYFEQVTCRVEGQLDIDAIEKSLQQLVSRYDVLRTVFLPRGYTRPLQMVLKVRKADFRYEDVRRECAGGSREAVVRHYQAQDTARKFDPGKDTLTRLLVLRTGEEQYIFIWSHHHIIMDGWCMGVLIRDFKAIYAQVRKREQPLLAPVKPYSQYISWLQDRDREQAADYWRGYLEGYENPATLPKREVLPSGSLPFSLASHEVPIPKDKTRLLHKMSREYGVTLNTIIQAAWGILLSRYNNVTDVVFGSVVSGRPAEIEGVETMIGLFINTIPVRVRCREEATIGDLLKELQASALQSEPYHYQPLSEIMAGSTPGRDLLDHILIVENYPLANEIMAGERETGGADDWRVTDVRVFEQTNYDLTITVLPAEEITIRLGYNANVYEKGIIEGISTHLYTILDQMTRNGRTIVSALEMIPEQEKQKLLYTFNDTRREYPREVTLVSLFEKQVQATPEKTAVVYEGMTLSYRQLNEQADRVAGFLRERYAIGRDQPVGIMIERCLEMITGLLGILKAGGAYLPLDPTYPKERIAYILQNSGAAVLLVKEGIPEGLGYAGTVLPMEMALGSDPVSETGWPEVNARDLCYLIYTSGSTGKPKGVMVSHYNVVNFMAGMSRELPVDENDSILAVTSTSFDISVLELFWTLCNGVKVIIHPSNQSFKGLDRYMPVTMMQTTPSLINLVKEDDTSKNFLRSLRLLLIGGEATTPALINSLKRHNPAEIYNMYGPTETTIWSCIHRFDDNIGKVSIGKPILNTQIYILDTALRLLPIGVAGDLYIGGEGLSRGYWGMPQLTNERFIDNPFIAGERIYMTGDVARWLPDGTIEYIGRMDHQVKLRGFRIELGEIENTLLQYEQIEETAVVVKGQGGDGYLVAYYVSGQPVEPVELKTFLSARLPSYMLPAFFVPLEKMPLTPNGKTDRLALPDMDASRENGHTAPAGRTEEKLVDIWSAVLKLDRSVISVDSDFFDLGGHSLTAMTLLNRIEKAFGRSIPLNAFLHITTIRGNASYLDAFADDEAEVELNDGQEQLTY